MTAQELYDLYADEIDDLQRRMKVINNIHDELIAKQRKLRAVMDIIVEEGRDRELTEEELTAIGV